MASLLPLLLALDLPPPPDVRLAATLLASPCQRCRDDGQRRMLRACRRDATCAAWARRGLSSPDAEVRWRSAAVLLRLAACPSCRGTGRVEIAYGTVHGERTMEVCCAACGGGRLDRAAMSWAEE